MSTYTPDTPPDESPFARAFDEADSKLNEALDAHLNGGTNARAAGLYAAQVIQYLDSGAQYGMGHSGLEGAMMMYTRSELQCELAASGQGHHCSVLRAAVLPATK